MAVNYQVSRFTENNIIDQEVLLKKASILSVFYSKRPPITVVLDKLFLGSVHFDFMFELQVGVSLLSFSQNVWFELRLL